MAVLLLLFCTGRAFPSEGYDIPTRRFVWVISVSSVSSRSLPLALSLSLSLALPLALSSRELARELEPGPAAHPFPSAAADDDDDGFTGSGLCSWKFERRSVWSLFLSSSSSWYDASLVSLAPVRDSEDEEEEEVVVAVLLRDDDEAAAAAVASCVIPSAFLANGSL